MTKKLIESSPAFCFSIVIDTTISHILLLIVREQNNSNLRIIKHQGITHKFVHIILLFCTFHYTFYILVSAKSSWSLLVNFSRILSGTTCLWMNFSPKFPGQKGAQARGVSGRLILNMSISSTRMVNSSDSQNVKFDSRPFVPRPKDASECRVKMEAVRRKQQLVGKDQRAFQWQFQLIHATCLVTWTGFHFLAAREWLHVRHVLTATTAGPLLALLC